MTQARKRKVRLNKGVLLGYVEPENHGEIVGTWPAMSALPEDMAGHVPTWGDILRKASVLFCDENLIGGIQRCLRRLSFQRELPGLSCA